MELFRLIKLPGVFKFIFGIIIDTVRLPMVFANSKVIKPNKILTKDTLDFIIIKGQEEVGSLFLGVYNLFFNLLQQSEISIAARLLSFCFLWFNF